MARTPKIPWEDIKLRYFAGESLRDLAGEYGVHYGTLRNRSHRESWAKQAEGERYNRTQRIIASAPIPEKQRLEIYSDVSGNERAARVGGKLLELISHTCDHYNEQYEDTGKPPRTSDLANLAKAYDATVNALISNQGEVGKSITTLAIAGILPIELIPKILSATTQSETENRERMARIVSGREP